MIERLFRRLYNNATLRSAINAGMKVGENTRFLGNHDFGSEPYLIEIGQNVTVSSNVTFITHDGGTAAIKRMEPERYGDVLKFGKITIENNVFIGSGCMIMPGVVIGENSVIGAGSVVTKDIPSNCVAAGVPAKVIKSIEEYAQCALEHTPDYNKTEYKTNKKETVIRMLEK